MVRKIWLVTVALCLFQTYAFAYCKNLPRLVCAEYSNSRLVVIASLVRTKHVMPKSQDEPDGFIYTLETARILKGETGQTFQIYEENSSGRAPFFWVKGETYLLFLNSNPDGTWWLYGCGNSAPLKGAGYALRAIDAMKSRKGGLVQGLIRGENLNPALERLSVEVRGDQRSYRAVTDKDGRFKIHVPAGHYVVRVKKEGWKFETNPLMTYEDPGNITIEDSGCAQVQFEAHASK